MPCLHPKNGRLSSPVRRSQAKAHYRSRGFTWYHLFPREIGRSPWQLFALRFFKGSFLAFSRQRRPRP
jgi:hypothetical protein